MTYTTKQLKQIEAIKSLLMDRYNHYKKNFPHATKDIDATSWHLEGAAKSILGLIEAQKKNRSIWADCVKSPRNLDSGRHHYELYFVDKKGIRQRVWLFSFFTLFNVATNKSHSGLSKWTFKSGAIGMSRLLDSTDGFFSFVKKCGGEYVQL